MKSLQLYASKDVLMEIMILRTVGITEKMQAKLLRLSTPQLRWIINNCYYTAYKLYLHNHQDIDYCYLLSNSLSIPRFMTQEVVISSFIYNCSLYFVLNHLEQFVNSIPIQYRPIIHFPSTPLFRDINNFGLLWKGSFPIIAL